MSFSGWVLAQGDDIAPIPGTKRVCYLEETRPTSRSHRPITPASTPCSRRCGADRARPRCGVLRRAGEALRLELDGPPSDAADCVVFVVRPDAVSYQ